MDQYYSDKLSAQRLKKCYDIAPPRTKQYLEAEINHALSYVSQKDSVIELGCGYGRFLRRFIGLCRQITGIDTSQESLLMARELLGLRRNVHLLQMNASNLAFPDNRFDVVLCVQNGISAFKIDPSELMSESIRVTRSGGRCLFSSYSKKFWDARLEWFIQQAEEGLLGEIDWDQTEDGVIVCKDGFRATTFGPDEFTNLTNSLGIDSRIIEVDDSSIFCEILVEK
jgi:2-polyprenyl-6-hydroxyphenyl methylase/3-demethylubiquinone-9 3-methyltransferase